jgi:hypothetical protein
LTTGVAVADWRVGTGDGVGSAVAVCGVTTGDWKVDAGGVGDAMVAVCVAVGALQAATASRVRTKRKSLRFTTASIESRCPAAYRRSGRPSRLRLPPLVDEHSLNKAIDSPFDALWWGVVTLTTVGYGDVYPVTTDGRIAAMALMLLGIGLFGAITATITSYLMNADLRRVEARVEADVALDKKMKKRTTASAERTSSAGSSLVSELERLAALHSAEALTDEEFAVAKASTLGRRLD